LIFAETAHLNDPQFAGDVSFRKSTHQGVDDGKQIPVAWFGGKSKYRDAVISGWPKKEGIAEIQIKGDQAAVLASASLDEFEVGYRSESFSRNCRHIVASVAQQFCHVMAKVFVELQ
jgi:hypothetical protein